MNHVLLTFDPLDASSAQSLAASPSCGAISLFIGVTRDNFQGVISTAMYSRCRLDLEMRGDSLQEDK